MSKIEEKVEKLVKEKIENLGYDLYDVEYLKEGKDYYLRIYIDKEEGIDLNDCEKVSNELDELLDEADYIKERYYLEVSSPGIERVLRKDEQLEKYGLENKIHVKLFKKDENGKKEYVGILKKFDDEILLVDDTQIQRKNIAQIKTVYDW